MLTIVPGDVSAAARTDVGRVRSFNEDAVLADLPVFAVADGMGGHAAGDVAAAIILDRLRTLVGRVPLNPDEVLDTIAAANDDVVRYGAEHPEVAGLGATLAGVCLGDVGGSPHWFVFNIGDARVYRLTGSGVQQVSVDHSEVQELVDAGQITRDAARTHPHRNIVTRSIGTNPAAAVDMWVVPAEANDRFMICSDGVTGELDDVELSEVLAASATASDAADELIERALKAGARDNVSVVVVDLDAPRGEDLAEVTAPRARLDGAPNA